MGLQLLEGASFSRQESLQFPRVPKSPGAGKLALSVKQASGLVCVTSWNLHPNYFHVCPERGERNKDMRICPGLQSYTARSTEGPGPAMLLYVENWGFMELMPSLPVDPRFIDF